MINRKSKHLYSNTCNETNIAIRCDYNINTDKIGFSIAISKAKYIKKPLNVKSPVYLGVNIAEKVLLKIFKDVKRMPYGNKGYDFICSQGYFIDVKSATSTINNTWVFHINKNIIADYFLCLAFDNRVNLKPLHLWLIPSMHVNHLITTSINVNTLNKWVDYEVPGKMKEVLTCCDILKRV